MDARAVVRFLGPESGPLLTRIRSAPAGTTRDVGHAVLFLAGTGAAAIRGQTFHVDAWHQGARQ